MYCRKIRTVLHHNNIIYRSTEKETRRCDRSWKVYDRLSSNKALNQPISAMYSFDRQWNTGEWLRREAGMAVITKDIKIDVACKSRPCPPAQKLKEKSQKDKLSRLK